MTPGTIISNRISGTSGSDEIFYFSWEDMKVDKLTFDLNGAKVTPVTQVTLAEEVLKNETDNNRDMTHSVDKGVTRTSTFEYGTGFTVTTGMEFRGAQNTTHRPVCGTIC